MEVFFKRLSLLSLILFILGILVSAYLLFNLKADLSNTAAIHVDDLPSVTPVITTLTIGIILTFVTGVASLLSARVVERSGSRENVIYVQSSATESKADVIRKNIGLEEESAAKDLTGLTDSLSSLRDEREKLDKAISALCMEIGASQGAFYKADTSGEIRKIRLASSFAFSLPESEILEFEFGEGLAGQVAKERKRINLDSVPEGYINILSGLGQASPTHLFITPVMAGDELYGVVEISSFTKINKASEELIQQIFDALTGSLASTKTKTAGAAEPTAGTAKPKKKAE